jgi:hypothetical protein
MPLPASAMSGLNRSISIVNAEEGCPNDKADEHEQNENSHEQFPVRRRERLRTRIIVADTAEVSRKIS